MTRIHRNKPAFFSFSDRRLLNFAPCHSETGQKKNVFAQAAARSGRWTSANDFSHTHGEMGLAG